MHETTEQTAALQGLLDRSYASAGQHLRSIHTDAWRMSADEVCATLSKVCILDLATVNAAARPYVAPVDGLFLHGVFWFGSSPESQRFRHIRTNPYVSAAHTLGEEISIIVHGIAREVDVACGAYEHLRDYCRSVYGASFDDWARWGEQPYAWIEPRSMFAIRIVLEDQ